MIAFAALGMLLVFINDIRHQPFWFGKQYRNAQTIIVVIDEVPVEKVKSYKAEASVDALISNQQKINATGKIIIYFKKDSSVTMLQPGAQLIFKNPLQPIKNTGNPDAFDYKRYALFNKITHQVYLTGNDFEILPGKKISWFQVFLNNTKDYVLATLTTYIQGKKELGLAEALLLGYKDDLDKNLLQSYRNTGVVHIIAVSGMHLALIYWLLNVLFKPLLKRKSTRWLHPVLVLGILWVFCFITGGAASIVRAAVMFTFITIAKAFNRNTSVYNTLAASAFCLLCYNPYWLWDVGFQLSYAAVLGIIIFYKPVYDLVFIKNKMLDWFWRLIVVSITAQILTTPFSIYHFHQFPVYFLITNLLAVPVSSVILIGELILVLLSPLKVVAWLLGNILSGLIWWLNTFIERLEKFPFALWEGLQINVLQSVLLIVAIAAAGFWLIEKIKPAAWLACSALLLFVAIRSYSFYTALRQHKIIVYNVPKNRAIDFIEGRNFYSVADTALLKDEQLNNFNIKPSRVLHRVKPGGTLKKFSKNGDAISFGNKKILLLNAMPAKTGSVTKREIDLLILSGNPRLYISNVLNTVRPKLIVIDGSVPQWKARYWKKDCDSLHIPFYDVAEKGAFVMNLR